LFDIIGYGGNNTVASFIRLAQDDEMSIRRTPHLWDAGSNLRD